MNNKNLDTIDWILIARPLLILSIIIGHAFAIYSGSWKFDGVQDYQIYAWVNPLFINFHLGAFFFISGYLFVKRTSKKGVRFIQGTTTQNIIKPNALNIKRYHYMGEKNSNNMTYLIRNCFFEPSSDHNKDWVNSCISDINKAFKNNKPAIICTHRVNYIGVIDPKNRDKNLRLLHTLFQQIKKLWPDSEFTTSDHLGEIMSNDGIQSQI